MTNQKVSTLNSHDDKKKKVSGYAPVNGLRMYYEIEGTGDPLVFIPPAFGAAGLQSFLALVQNHSVITVDLHGNGRTADIPERPLSIRAIYNKLGSIQWSGFSKEELGSIKVPTLVIVGDHDFVRVEHAVEGFKAIPGAELAVIPSASHFVLYSEQERVIPIVKHFLEKPEEEIPLATAETGYHPGKTR